MHICFHKTNRHPQRDNRQTIQRAIEKETYAEQNNPHKKTNIILAANKEKLKAVRQREQEKEKEREREREIECV